jgi:hypothetical protein
MMRTAAVSHFSWAVPTLPVVMEIASFAPGGLVEVGAGTGYWSRLLADVGTDVIAVDNFSEWGRPSSDAGNTAEDAAVEYPLFYDVINTDGTEYIRSGQAGERALFFCWPRGDFNAREGFPGYEGNRVIFIGEEEGCTADIATQLLRTGCWEVVGAAYMPRWKCMNDVCVFLERKK